MKKITRSRFGAKATSQFGAFTYQRKYLNTSGRTLFSNVRHNHNPAQYFMVSILREDDESSQFIIRRGTMNMMLPHATLLTKEMQMLQKTKVFSVGVGWFTGNFK